MNVAILPARGGSKRIPRKNIRSFLGRPIIHYALSTARASGCFDRIVVSTDDPEIARIAREYGAEVPFLRPVSLSDDQTPLRPVICDMLARWPGGPAAIKWVCMIMPTAPFMRADDLREGLRRLEESPNMRFAISVTSFAFPIQRALRIHNDGLQPFDHESISRRSQDLEPAYHPAGQFTWGSAEAFMSDAPMLSSQTLPIVLPRHRVQDIDTEEDWQRAECLYRMLRETVFPWPDPLPELMTPRLVLRPMRESDTPLVVRWRNAPHVAVMSRSPRQTPFTEADHLAWFRSSREQRVDYIMMVRETGEAIGSVSLVAQKDKDDQWFGIPGRYIGEPAHMGRGYAKEAAPIWLQFAFDVLKLPRLQSQMRSDNHANIAINRKLGFRELPPRIQDGGHEWMNMELRAVDFFRVNET